MVVMHVEAADREGGVAAPPAQPVIAVKDLSLTFDTGDGPVYALSKVDLTVNEGEFVSFIGPSGCGKTTLLRVIANLEQPTSGSILINGVTPEAARLGRQYGYVFQAPALYPWRTIERNVMLPLEVMGFSETERRARAAVSHSWTMTVNHSSMTWVVTRKTISPGSSERVCWRWVSTSACT